MKIRDIPSVNTLLENLEWETVEIPREYVTFIIRRELANLRRMAENGEIPFEQKDVKEQIHSAVMRMNAPSLKKVINGTGIILHTGLGRAPLSRATLRKTAAEMEGYSALELDLESGKRGERNDHVSPMLNSLTGAESSLVVNNNAAAVLLSLNTLAEGKEVIVSRGQLVEIGGLFRIPDVVGKSGAKLVEVGTTNRTHFKDYLEAISERTAVILVVHTSNYRIKGFTEAVPVGQLAELSQKKTLTLVADLGSGALFDLESVNLPYEPTVAETLKQGVHLVTFSGDKLLGGPQAGLICGRKRLISRLHRNPLYRALRCDKMTLALLERTLRSYRETPPHGDNLTYTLLTTSRKTLMNRGVRLQESLRKTTVERLGLEVVASQVEAGSGSLPTEMLESAALRFRSPKLKPGGFAKRFRESEIPILGYISGNRFYVDLKTVLPHQYEQLAGTLEDVAKDIG